MASFIHFMQGSFFGQVLYHLSGKRLFQYKEEKADYVIPEKYLLNSPPSPRTEDNASVKENNEQSKELDSNGIVVTWESDDDPDNPHNWPLSHKVLFISQVGFLTWSIYMGSSWAMVWAPWSSVHCQSILQ
jgi:DHA1 family multidrug resistance protein-like MFS transporter